MPIISSVPGYDADEAEELEFKRLTAQEAQALRELEPSTSPWRIVGLQVLVGLLAALVAGVLTGRAESAWSAGYGGLVVVVPAVLFARGLRSQFSSINAATAAFGFFVWEAIKIAVSVGLLIAAPRLIANLDWLALLISLIVTQKVYWVALLMRPKRNILKS